MSVIGSDSRSSTTDFTTFPLSVVTTVDVTFQEPWGSGIVIGPNHVLTAGHVGNNSTIGTITTLRTVLSSAEDGLNSRRIGDAADPAANVTNLNFLKNYDTERTKENDILLLTTSTTLVSPSDAIGIIAFANPDSADGLTIDTAGYPSDFNQGRDLVSAPDGTIADTRSNGRMFYSIDTAPGQSGSGVWHTLDGDSADRVLGVHTHGTGQNPLVSPIPIIGRNNGGVLITLDVYAEITEQMRNDASGSLDELAADLPENALVGSDPGFFFGNGADFISGDWRRERIIGEGGDDRLLGGGANDRIEGGDGVDQALFSGLFTDYDFTITDPNRPSFEFVHARGTKFDGTDTTMDVEFGVFEFDDADSFGTPGYGTDDDGDLFFVPLQVDPDDNTKLKDGPLLDPEAASVDILDSNAEKIGTLSTEIPAFMFDGDVDYTLNVGAEDRILFNFAYIVDSSGSMGGLNIIETKSAFQALTQSLIDQGVAERSNFAVVDFDSSARLFPNLTAEQAIATVNGLVASGGTNFGPPLSVAEGWFESLSNVDQSTNIAYFLSDGFGSGASAGLQLVNEGQEDEAIVDVRAFGIGTGADLTSLNIIDSGNAVLLSDPSDLTEAFSVSGINKDTIDRIDVKLDGVVVDTIAPDQLVDSPLGLTFEGTIENLEVTRTAENNIDFEIIFNDGTPSATLSTKITTGQEEVREQTADGTRVVVTFSVNQSDFIGGEESAIVNANDLGNKIRVVGGNNILRGNGGDDRFLIDGGSNIVDGGDGTDTAVFAGTLADAGGVSRTGGIVTVGTSNTLFNIEFIEFDDVRLDATSLQPISIATISTLAQTVDETATSAELVVALTSPALSPVTVDFATRDDSATAGDDYLASATSIIINVGETEGRFTVNLLPDNSIEGDEVVLVDISLAGNAVFSDGMNVATAAVQISDDDALIAITADEDAGQIVEGTGGQNLQTITIERFGNLDGTDTVEVTTGATTGSSVDAADFVGGFSSDSITFAPGESLKTFEFEIATDSEVESDETLAVALTAISGTATVVPDEAILTILNDDELNQIIGTDRRDFLSGTVEGDLIDGLRGNDKILGKGGDDSLIGGEGRDRIYAGGGDDALFGGPGRDKLWGGYGNDELFGESGKDKLFGGWGDDWLQGGEDNDWIRGGSGDDTLLGGAGRDFLSGGWGADTFVFEADTAFDGVDRILGFSVRRGDVLDLRDLLEDFDESTDSISDFVQVTGNLFRKSVSVDVDGGGDGFVQIADIVWSPGLSTNEQQLVDDGTLIFA